MMLTSDVLTCSFVTAHVGYHEVPGLLSVERIVEVIELTREAMRRIRGKEPKIVVCGLNPHAGEHGLFGNQEEERIILPAIEEQRTAGANIEGPLPPDTAFLEWRRAETDAFVCMYHDQGHIPLKALAFDKAINTTLGLPIVRTSVDHGTALDIAWQGKANSQSLIEAVHYPGNEVMQLLTNVQQREAAAAMTGRFVQLTNAGGQTTNTVTRTIGLAVNSLEPGGIQTPHRTTRSR